MTSAAIWALVTGLCFGIVAFVATIPAPTEDGSLRKGIRAAHVARMFATIGAGAIGAFAATRNLTLEELVVSAVLIGTLATAVAARPSGDARALSIVGIGLFVAVLSAMLDGMWHTVGTAALASSPFFATALFVRERRASVFDGGIAAIAGIALGTTESVLLVLFVACLSAIAYVKVTRRASAVMRFAPYIAAFTLATVLVQVALVA